MNTSQRTAKDAKKQIKTKGKMKNRTNSSTIGYTSRLIT